MLKKTIFSLSLFGVVVLAAASSGGGDNKNMPVAKSGLLSLRSNSGVVLKAGPDYRRSLSNSGSSQFRFSQQNAVLTYRKGNIIYILPYQQKIQTASYQGKTNLNLINVKLNLHK